MPPPAMRRTNLVLIQETGAGLDRSGWTGNKDWTEHTKAWVSINPLRGREVTRDAMSLGTVTHDIRGDWLDLKDVSDGMRIVFVETGIYDPLPEPLTGDYRTFDIVAVMRDEDEHNDVLLKAEEKLYGDGA
ncbi:phage head completion protein [Oceaniradius stylonematis]|uniref:phage head completion protein n=1 Tax=Oceaniradius stylonematis TaxID=2184161 RepID=UPI00273EB969|nr:head-tail adaptor protein [Oceaniradius stylonematis]